MEFLPERRSTDPIDRLSREMDAVCRTAIDSIQVAAALEAAGLNDRTVRERYGLPGVFALAAELRRRVPHRLEAGDARRQPEGLAPPSTVALLLRGPIYLVPVLFFLALGDVLGQSGLVWITIGSLLPAWMWNQGVGSLLYRLIGRKEPAAARRLARRSLWFGTAAVTVIALPFAGLVFGDVWLVWPAGLQTAYLISSTNLLILSRQGLLMSALLPGSAIAAYSLLASSLPDTAVLGVAAGTVAAVVAAMIWITRGVGSLRLLPLARYEILAAGGHALAGGVWALLIGLAGVAIAPDGELVTRVSLAAAPMVLLMGLAEWLIMGIRSRARARLAATDQPDTFLSEARGIFGEALGVYWVLLTLLTTASILGASGLMDIGSDQLLLSLAFLFLGGASFSSLAMLSLGRLSLPVALSGSMAAFTLAIILAAPEMDRVAVYAGGCLVLALVLSATAARQVSDVVVFR
jgi:hypothetical protein